MRASLVAALVVLAAAPAVAKAAEEKPIVVEAGSSHHLRLGATISRVSVGATDVADVAPFPPDQLLVTRKRVGQTTVTVWYRNDEVSIFTNRVPHAVSAINEALARAIPDGKDVRATSAGAAVVLSGEVQSASDVEHAEQIVRGVGGEGSQIVDLLRVAGDNQGQLQVSFAEVSRPALRGIGGNFWAQ